MDTNTNIYSALEHLVDQWYKNAASFDGYQAETATGDSPRLLLTLQRMNNGDVCLTAMSVRDFMKSIPPSGLLQPEDLEMIDGIPTTILPVASLTIRRGNSS